MSANSNTPLLEGADQGGGGVFSSCRRPSAGKLAIVGLVAYLLVALVLCTVLFSVLLSAHSNNGGRNDPDTDCFFKGDCNTTIFDYLNSSVDPCQDFYAFSCGNWPRLSNDDLALYESWGRTSELTANNAQHIGKHLSSAVQASDPSAIKKAKFAFAACSDTDYIILNLRSYVQNFMRETGGWRDAGITPVTPWNINSSLANEHYLGSNAFFSFSIGPDDLDSSKAVISVTQGGLTLDSPEKYDNPDGKYFEDLLGKISVYLDTLKVNNETLVYKIAHFERDLALRFERAEALRVDVATYHPMTLAVLTDIFNMDWVNYFNTLFGKAGSNQRVNSNTVVIVKTPSYFHAINHLLYDPIVVDYAKWRLLHNKVDLGLAAVPKKNSYTDTISQDARFSVFNAGSTAVTCALLVEQAMPLAVARLFVDEFISDQIRNTVKETIDVVEKAFKQRIMQKSWLDEASKDKCVSKVDSIIENIAYPDFIKSSSEIDVYYAKFSISSSNNYFEVVAASYKFAVDQKLSLYGKAVDRKQWLEAPSAVNAYFSQHLNQLAILAGILRPPFFSENWPSFVLYGAIGTIIGHELVHGFDDQGRQYDMHGNRVQWWTNDSVSNFIGLAECVQHQYDAYSLQGYQMNGFLTLGENIADNGGVHIAYQAYKNSTIGTEGSSIRGYSQDQLFFISFAQSWCSQFTGEALLSMVMSASHSPGPIRVLGALSNSEEFATAFNCPNGARMNPTSKCELW